MKLLFVTSTKSFSQQKTGNQPRFPWWIVFLLAGIAGFILMNSFPDFIRWYNEKGEPELSPERKAKLDRELEELENADRVEKIYFVPVFLPSADENREEEFRYDEAERTIFLRVELDPEQLAGIGKEDFLKYVIHAFIGELEKLEVLPERLMEKIGQVLFQNEQD